MHLYAAERCSAMAMNETIRETMQKELAKSKDGWGAVVALVSFFGLYLLVVTTPGLAAFAKLHKWVYWIIIIVSAAAGGLVSGRLDTTARGEIARMDDDTLKFRHDAMSRRKLKGDVIACLAVALVVAYFIFRK